VIVKYSERSDRDKMLIEASPNYNRSTTVYGAYTKYKLSLKLGII